MKQRSSEHSSFVIFKSLLYQITVDRMLGMRYTWWLCGQYARCWDNKFEFEFGITFQPLRNQQSSQYNKCWARATFFRSRYRDMRHFLKSLCHPTTAPLFQLKFLLHRISATAPHFREKIRAIKKKRH